MVMLDAAYGSGHAKGGLVSSSCEGELLRMSNHMNRVSPPHSRIVARAQREPTATFDNVWHIMTVEELADCLQEA